MKRKLIILTVLLSSLQFTQGQMKVFIGNDTTFCAANREQGIELGSSLVIKNAVPPLTYTWSASIPYAGRSFSASDFLNDTTIANPKFKSALLDQTWNEFMLEVKDNNGNTARDTILVRFSNFKYSPGYSGIDINVGDSVLLGGLTVDGGILPYVSYSWSPGTYLSTPNQQKTWCRPMQIGEIEYGVSVTDSVGCVSSFSTAIRVMVHPIPLLKTENLWSVLNRRYADGVDPVYMGTSLLSQWLKTGNDTIIGGKKYKIMMSSSDGSHSMWEKGLGSDKKELLLREEYKKVYQYHGEIIGESLLYDFNLHEGDVISRPFNPGIWTNELTSRVDLVRDTIIDNISRKIFYISNSVGTAAVIQPETWIEGIGSSWGLFRQNISYFTTGMPASISLLCFYQDDKLIYHDTIYDNCYYQQGFTGNQHIEEKAEINVFPNPSSGIFTIQTETNNENSVVQIYNINGKLVRSYQIDQSGRLEVDMTGSPKGIYLIRLEKQGIQGTKKLIIR